MASSCNEVREISVAGLEAGFVKHGSGAPQQQAPSRSQSSRSQSNQPAASRRRLECDLPDELGISIGRRITNKLGRTYGVRKLSNIVLIWHPI